MVAIILTIMVIIANIIFRGGEIPHKLEPNIYVVFGLLFSGFYEEIIFRGCLQNILKIQLGDVLAVIFQTFLFVIIHSPEKMLYYIALGGIVFGSLMYKSKSIVPGYIAHVGNNMILFSIT